MSTYLDVAVEQARQAGGEQARARAAALEQMRLLTTEEVATRGGDVSSILEDLEELRLIARREHLDEDIILDLMDFVTGWCSPHMKIRH